MILSGITDWLALNAKECISLEASLKLLPSPLSPHPRHPLSPSGSRLLNSTDAPNDTNILPGRSKGTLHLHTRGYSVCYSSLVAPRRNRKAIKKPFRFRGYRYPGLDESGCSRVDRPGRAGAFFRSFGGRIAKRIHERNQGYAVSGLLRISDFYDRTHYSWSDRRYGHLVD